MRRVALLTAAFLALAGSPVPAGDSPEEIRATLDAIREKYRQDNLPPRLAPPLTEDDVRTWSTDIAELLDEELPADLRTIDGLKGHPNADRKKVSSARHWVGFDAKRRIRLTLDQGCQLLDGGASEAVRFADFILQTDPGNVNHVRNRILGDGSRATNLTKLREGLHAVALAKSLDEGLGRKAPADRAAQKARIESAIEHYHACVEKAKHLVRMPAARSTDPELLKIAEQTLKDPRYEVNPWKRLVINFSVHRRQSAIVRKEKRPRRVWDEFQVATAEKIGDRWFIFYNRLRNFHRGESTTPTGKWILAERFRSVEILEENIEK